MCAQHSASEEQHEHWKRSLGRDTDSEPVASAVWLSSLPNFLSQFLNCKIEVSINWRYSVLIKDTLGQNKPELVLPLSTQYWPGRTSCPVSDSCFIPMVSTCMFLLKWVVGGAGDEKGFGCLFVFNSFY